MKTTGLRIVDSLRHPHPAFTYLYGERNKTMKAPLKTGVHVANGNQAAGDPVKGRIAVLRAAWVQRVKVVVDVKNPERAYKMKTHVINLRKLMTQ